MHSHRPTVGALAALLSRQFARLRRVARAGRPGGRIAYTPSPTAGRPSHGGSGQPPKRGKANDEAHRGRARADLTPSRRSGHRVWNVRLLAALRGRRQRGWARRRISVLDRCAAPSAVFACVALFTLVFLLVAAGQAPADDGVYRRPIANDPSTLDPAVINDIYGRSVAQQIFDGLVSFDQNLEITPS